MVELAPGQLITPSIRLDEVLGRGGMGSLWLASHLKLKVRVVVKFIASEFAGNPDVMARFEREAAATMAAKSAHVVQILDYGFTEQKVPFIAMEYLDGEDLASRIERERRIAPAEFAEILKQACKGLTRAHAQGIIHRDIKPENIFLTYVDGELTVKVLDFGIAKADAAFGFGATRTGVFLGTVYYMSPEQSMGAKGVDHRTDLWSLGVVAYYALTGVRPFQADAIGALVTGITSGPISPPSSHFPALGSPVDRWMSRALARDPGRRFGSAKDMAAAFEVAVAQIAPVAEWTGRKPAEDSSDAAGLASSATFPDDGPESSPSGGPGVRADAKPTQTVPYRSTFGAGGSGTQPTGQIPSATPAAMSASIGPFPIGALEQPVDIPTKSRSGFVKGVGIGIALSVAIVVGAAFIRAGHSRATAKDSEGSAEGTKAPAAAVAPPMAIGGAQSSTTAEPPSPTAGTSAQPSASAANLPPPANVRAAPPTSNVNRKAPARPSPAHSGNPFDGTY